MPYVPPTGASTDACTAYCTAIMTNCTGGAQQYKDQATCMKACSFLPAGTAGDNSGDSIACRTTAAMAAATDTTMPKASCWHAGPLGYGACGEECEAFCTLTMGYCSAASGYTGAPVYASYDECHLICGNFGRVVDFADPGIYSANAVMGDTLECRAYHLVDNAMVDAAGQAIHCPHAASDSTAACGPGPGPIVVPPPVMNPVGGDAGAPMMPVGPANTTLNSTNWDETKYPFATRRMLLRDEGDPHMHLTDLGNPANDWSTPAGGPWARAMQFIGNNQILGGRNDGYEVFDLTTGAIVKTVNTFGNTQSAYRMANGETMLVRSGTTLTFLDKNDQVAHEISYPGYGYVRVGRPTRNGTFLIPADQTVFEGDANGNVLWTDSGEDGWGHIWEPLLMASGDTLLCTAFGASCDIIDKTTHKVTFRYGTKNMPMADMFKPNFFSEYQILWNGNIITSNWQGHGAGNGNSGIQVIEFNPAGDVVWSYKQDPAVFSSIQGVMVIDGMDPANLYVQETSPDSTWQPVIPMP
jgi:hypothetical protein